MDAIHERIALLPAILKNTTCFLYEKKFLGQPTLDCQSCQDDCQLNYLT